MHSAAVHGYVCRFVHGAPDARIVRDGGGWAAHLPLRVLGGNPSTILPLAAGEAFVEGPVHGVRGADGSVGGFLLLPADVPSGIEAAAIDAYTALFSALGTASVCRVWNFVPGINECHDGQENYWHFNAGRRIAFEQRFGPSRCEAHMPAASAVGWDAPLLFVAFIGTTRPVRFVENPHQVPAYRYPGRYGPRPPSFSRGAAVGDPPQLGFLSGTASIQGHDTVGVGDVRVQVDVTLRNMEAVMRETGLARWESIKGYVRHDADAGPVREALAARFGAPGADALMLQADICRPDLDVEIEAILAAGS